MKPAEFENSPYFLIRPRMYINLLVIFPTVFLCFRNGEKLLLRQPLYNFGISDIFKGSIR